VGWRGATQTIDPCLSHLVECAGAAPAASPAAGSWLGWWWDQGAAAAEPGGPEADAALRLLTGPATASPSAFWSVHLPSLDVALTLRLSGRASSSATVMRLHADDLTLAVWDRRGTRRRRSSNGASV